MKKSLQHLEFDKIKKELAGYCHSSQAKEIALLLEPGDNFDEIIERQNLADELQELLKIGYSFDFNHLTPVSQLFHNYAYEAYNYEEFTAVYFIAKTASIIVTTIEEEESDFEGFTSLLSKTSTLSNLSSIATRYEQIFGADGEVLDSASAELRSIRKRLIRQRQNILDTLQRTLQNKSYENLVQDKIITQRDNRYVIPLKEGATSTVPGIIHSSSSSRATVFVEPLETVQMNNELHHLRQAEQEEIYRIFCSFTSDIQQYSEELMRDYDTLTELDYYFAVAKMGNHLHAKTPRLTDKPIVSLKEARHPLLILAFKDRNLVIPFDLTLGQSYNLLVLSGPNTGGKTVTLKSVGLLTLMALSGLPITADENSTIGIFNHVLADIGDHQSLEDSLSTFSGHLKSIQTMLQLAGENTLILIDEIGAATDPEQGAALAQAVLEELDNRGVKGIVTTHYTPLKIYARNSQSCLNAAMQFDQEKHLPTYQFKSGTPGNSFALEIAAKLGFEEKVLERAKSLAGKQNVELTELLSKLSKEQMELSQARVKYEHKHKLAEMKVEELEAKLLKAEQEKVEIRQKALKEAQFFLSNIQNELNSEIKGIEKQEREEKKKLLSEVSKKAAVKNQKLIEEQKSYTEQELEPLQTPKIGLPVWVKDLDAYGKIASIEKNGIKIDLDGFFLTTDLNNLFIAKKSDLKKKPTATTPRQKTFTPSEAKTELKVLGLTFDEALPKIDIFLDQGYSAGLRMLRIVHGKGTGILRKKIRNYLGGVVLVKEFYSPAPEAGGDGVTVVVL
ncbi:MAG: endonuclease MutS2 [Candidatus Cloacimonas sp.]|nr:endonuclease MutS2 [Candidatus Cloacimonadota bacterium]